MPSIQVLATEIVASLEPREIILRLVERALDVVPADRCTLTSLDQHVLRAEASFDRTQGRPSWVGREYPLSNVVTQPLLRMAVESGSPVTGEGFESNSIDADTALDLSSIRRTAVVPLSLGDEVVAVLVLSRRADVPFEPALLGQLQEIGVLAVMALRNARLYQAVQDAHDRGLHTLTMISDHLASSDELPVFFGKMSATVAHLVNAEKAAFWRLENGVLAAQPEAFGFGPELEQMRVSVDEDITAPLRGLLYGGQAITARVSKDALDGAYGQVLRLMGVRDVIAVPWKTALAPLGILVACNSRSGFAAQDEWVMRVAARASALVWQGYEAERRVVELQERERRSLEEQAAHAAELEREKSQFLRLASHELRTPLTIVRGYLSMFEEGVFGELPERAAAALPTITSRVAQMNLLIDQMLDTARLEDSRLVVSRRPTELTGVVDRVVASFEGLRQPGQSLVAESPDGKVVADADPDKLETIVANLVSNAIKYSPGGGEVKVTVRRTGERATIAVKDSGVGIRAEDLPRLFQRFGRLERPETANVEGTGLGLFLCRELARLQGGEIAVESEPGRGSAFTISVPASVTGRP